jgi:addiction module RelE/StbE family toxin
MSSLRGCDSPHTCTLRKSTLELIKYFSGFHAEIDLSSIKSTKKFSEIRENPHHYKPLSGSMHGERRVHIGSFVLTYEIDEARKTVIFVDFDHHDHVYEKD